MLLDPIRELPAFLAFEPVRGRARHDGWSPALQRRFILLLGCGCAPADAARRLGRSRQGAYTLRRRPGAGGFAQAWDRAREFAQLARRAGRALPLPESGFEAIWVPRFYRGRLVGFVQREDHRAALRTLARLDRLASSIDAPPEDFDLDLYLESLDGAGAAESRQS